MLPWEVLRSTQNRNEAKREITHPAPIYETFEQYHVPKAIRVMLEKEFGITTPSQIQKLTLPTLLQRTSVLVAAASGTGKTMSYLLPMYLCMQKDRDIYKVPTRECRPRAIILVPTQELCRQISRWCKEFDNATGLKSVTFMGMKRSGHHWNRLRQSSHRLMDVLITTPAILSTRIENRRLFLDDIRHVVVDEADTLISYAHDYTAQRILNRIRDRNIYQWLWEVNTQIVLVSSVVTESLTRFLDKSFPKMPRLVSSDLHRPAANTRHRFIEMRRENYKLDWLAYILRRCGYRPQQRNAPISQLSSVPQSSEQKSLAPIGSTSRTSSTGTGSKTSVQDTNKKRILIFSSDIKTTIGIFYRLQGRGYPVAQFHARLPLKERAETYEKWLKGDVNILCTSDIMSRGLDGGVNVVINYTMPNHSALYLQRAGRTGQCGRPAAVISLFTSRQRTIVGALKNLLFRNLPLTNVSNWWGYYKPTVKQWIKKRRNKMTRKFVRIILRRAVAPHLEKTYLKTSGTFAPPFHPRTVEFHKGVPPRQTEKKQDREAYRAWEARRGHLAGVKKGSAKFGCARHGPFNRSFKHIANGTEGGDVALMQSRREAYRPSITSKY